MSVKKQYYSLNKNQFEEYLSSLKNNPNSLFLFSDKEEPYFYVPDEEISNKLLALNKKQWEFDSLFDSFSDFGKSQLMQSFFLDEIESTNLIESINSTRHDIFSVMNSLSSKKDKNIDAIIHYYQMLLKSDSIIPTSLKDIRDIYDQLIKDSLNKEDMPDGEYFRKDIVYISDGIKKIHQGFHPEEKVNQGMEDFLSLYQSEREVYFKGILTHFMLETVHPYYDGNGRLGRYLFSSLLLNQEHTSFAFLISKSIHAEKSKYYSALKEGRDIHEFGCVNEYVSQMCDILLRGIENAIKELKEKKERINGIKTDSSYTKSENKIFCLLKEGTILSYYGLSNEEIMKETHVSKRTLIYTLNKFREQGILENTQFGKFSYHKIKE